jgi:hypothetical protein
MDTIYHHTVHQVLLMAVIEHLALVSAFLALEC